MHTSAVIKIFERKGLCELVSHRAKLLAQGLGNSSEEALGVPLTHARTHTLERKRF